MSITVADLTERDLIARIQTRLPPAPDWMLVGIGDDAAVVEPERNRVEVLSVDALVEGVHFDRAFVPPDAIGHRALAVNLSDLAAMGAAPRLALLSFALPSDLPIDDFDAVVTGLTALALRHNVHVAGGNLTRSPGPLMLDVTVVGTVKRRQALTRKGARPGDELYVSGTIGAAAAGLQMLQSAVGSQQSAVERYLRPEPRVRLGLMLARNRAAAACIDLSDGLAEAVHQLAVASGVGAVIDAENVPIDPAVREWYEARGLDPVAESLAAGDDYELLFAVRPGAARRLAAASRHGGAPITRIGRCTKGHEVTLRRVAGGSSTESSLPRTGFMHFRQEA
ncbi:MAG: thiamine-phosphate kinase [Vicinamibacterales bacterium]